jgi:hypothetical protein
MVYPGVAFHHQPESVRLDTLFEDFRHAIARPGERRGTFGEEPKLAVERTAPAFDVSDVPFPDRLETPTIL